MELTGCQAPPQVFSDVGRHNAEELASWTGRQEESLVSLVGLFSRQLVSKVHKRTTSEAAERLKGHYDVAQNVKVNQQRGAVSARLCE